MKRGEFVIYPEHASALTLSTGLDGIIFTMNVKVGFLPAEYGEDFSSVQAMNKWECNRNTTISETSELVFLENFIAQTSASTGRERKTKVLHGWIRSVLDALYRWHNEGFEVTPLSSSCGHVGGWYGLSCCSVVI